jgi:Uma2 family endonuclease
MSIQIPKTVYYPESDGRPMGETDEHRDAMVRIIELLMNHYRGKPVYVSGDLLVYYEQGNPKKFVVPDAFIAKGLKQKRRRIYRLWIEGVVPQLVIETTSLKTKKKDLVDKPELYARLGIREYVMHDPTGEYLDPPLQLHRLQKGTYLQIQPNEDGGLLSEELGLVMRIEDGELNLFDPVTKERLLTNFERANNEAEARQLAEESLQREAEGRQREAEGWQREVEAREHEVVARKLAEAEIERLRAELAKYKS